ncbi:MAG: long-chain-fatty-acid--CoA ligase [Hyphomicrobiales bacterium]
MKALMQDWPLLIHTILDHAENHHGDAEVVSRTVEGPIHRYTYKDLGARARRLADAAKKKLGIEEGDVVGTMAWNGYRHMETWYAIMGIGAVVHTLNPRLFKEQLTYIINHAEDGWFFLDLTFVPILEGVRDELETVKGFVIMTDRAHMPETSLKNVVCYEELLEEGRADFSWPKLDENIACGMCYTSGTTGNPKGVVYSQRSNVIHAMATCAADALAISCRETVMPVVPMFHANAWTLVFATPMSGSKLVLPGPLMDGASIYELLSTEGVTMTAAVPTIWLMLLQYLESNPDLLLPDLQRVVIGGSACPESMMDAFEQKYDSQVIHAWGMTEMSPLGTLCTRKPGMSDGDWKAARVKQGRTVYTVELKITDDDGNLLPHDGKAFGHLMVRGPAISSAYHKGEGGNILDDEGYFDTGDVSTLDEEGYMQITDRSKDVIKSGGEWISSIDLENLAVGHPDVTEAAVIGIAHPKWDERPLLVIVAKEGTSPTGEELLAYMEGKIAKWWMPDDVAFVDEIPHTATGKISKLRLREQFESYTFPRVNAAE